MTRKHIPRSFTVWNTKMRREKYYRTQRPFLHRRPRWTHSPRAIKQREGRHKAAGESPCRKRPPSFIPAPSSFHSRLLAGTDLQKTRSATATHMHSNAPLFRHLSPCKHMPVSERKDCSHPRENSGASKRSYWETSHGSDAKADRYTRPISFVCRGRKPANL